MAAQVWKEGNKWNHDLASALSSVYFSLLPLAFTAYILQQCCSDDVHRAVRRIAAFLNRPVKSTSFPRNTTT
jgi:hypothetical protein